MTSLKGSDHARRLHQCMSRLEIEELQRYAETVEKLLADEAMKFESLLDALAASLPEEERSDYLEQYSDEYHELKRAFPNQLRYSLLTASYSTVESRLVSIAKTLAKLQNSRLSVSDLGGNSPLAKVRTFINKVVGIELPNELWEGIEPYRLVRNVIVHSSGQFLDNPPLKVRTLASEPIVLSIDNTGYVELGRAFVPAFFEAMNTFYGDLFSAWESWSRIRRAL